MNEKFNSLEPEVQAHISKLAISAKIDESDETLERFAELWLEKQQSFYEQTKACEMEEADTLNIDDVRGALIMTYSGSLINIGPEQDDMRCAQYFSIGLRNDVPESAEENFSVLLKNIEKGNAVEFEKGPIVKSSPVFAITVFKEEKDPHDQEILLDEITMTVAEDFAAINKTYIAED